MNLTAWLDNQWKAIQQSYDRTELVASSQPLFIGVTAAALAGVVIVIGYVPPLALASGFRRPWVSLLFVAVGAALSYVAWKHACDGTIGTLATILDNGFYSAALSFAAANTRGNYAVGLAVAHGLMVLGFAAQLYSLTSLLAVVFLVPCAMAVGLYRPSPAVTLILVGTYIMVLIGASMTGRRRKLLREKAQLRRAVGAAAQVADESVQSALATTLLSLGHLLHELRNAQTAVRSNLSFIQMQATLDPEATEALEDALEAQAAEERLIIDTIESLKRRAKPSEESFVLSEVVDLAAVSHGVVVEMHSRHPFVVRGSGAHLTGVLTNLIRNAHQAGARNIHITTRLEPSGRAVELTVHDDGPGIAERQREELFKPFVTVGKMSGTGLGLYLCRRYIELLGGTITIAVGPLGGAAFVMVLPGESMTELAAQTPSMPRKKKKAG